MNDNRFRAPTGVKQIAVPSLEDKALEKYLKDFSREILSAFASLSGSANSIGSGLAQTQSGITGNADTVDGYHANTGVVAGTIPVRDANGKVPGSITGEANFLDGYHADAGVVAGTIPVRNASGIIPGSISGNAATATRIGARSTVYQSTWEFATQCPDNYGITWLACSGKWWSYNNQDAPEANVFTYFEITAVGAREFLIIAYTGNNIYYGIASWGEPYRIWGGWNRIGNSKCGLKNSIYAVTWSISLTTGREFHIHQPVNVSFSATNPVIAAYANGAWRNIHSDGANSTTNRTYSLAPGQYRNINSGTITMYIGHATSATQSDIITLW